MAISITWATKVIFVPQADLTPLGGSVYELDTDQFRKDLNALQASVDGIAFDTTHEHTAPKTLAGVTYARFVEIINGYTVEFENGTYQVNLVGSNNNLMDVKVVNSVSMVPSNSAGLIQVVSGSGLSAEQADMLLEIWRLHALDSNFPLTVTPTSRDAGTISQTISGDGESSSTVTRT